MDRLYEKTEEVEKEVLRMSLTRAKNLDELAGLYRRVNYIKKEFLECSFSKYSLEELEQLRFAIQEQLLNLKIMIKKCKSINSKVEEKAMKELWDLNQSS